ncbi:hypothetical protein EJP67_16570 [Variovorax guangxiensis]|uniref:Uncharacterized protein n=1 Tax=Variovorax guangxiensis TaxID=1775474 RepID=A0A433ML81_9BURK|nr:hypothetical protein [Variovorax guangxiensis]RUR68677.1 hypothetical protein EJP67_16570 [Variovorax guangxiensis]
MTNQKPTTYVADRVGDLVIAKDPDAVLDYPFDWTAWLALNGDDQIASAEFVVDPSLTIVDQAFDATSATVWLSGGTKPATGPNKLRVTCRITTNNTPPRIDDRSVFLKILER